MTYSKAAKLSRGLLFQFVLCGVEATIPASGIDHIEAGCGRSLTVIPRPQVRSSALPICGADNDPLLFEQACIIAENDFVLRAIHAQQLAAVERVQEVTAIALAKGDNSLALANARSLRSRLAYDELVALRDKVLQQYKDELPDLVETQAEQLISRAPGSVSARQGGSLRSNGERGRGPQPS